MQGCAVQEKTSTPRQRGLSRPEMACLQVVYKLHLDMNSGPVVRVDVYATATGKIPFERWLDGLRDRVARAKVRVQIDRLSLGNFGTCRFLKGGLGELRVDWGPGYRVYFATLDRRSVLF